MLLSVLVLRIHMSEKSAMRRGASGLVRQNSGPRDGDYGIRLRDVPGRAHLTETGIFERNIQMSAVRLDFRVARSPATRNPALPDQRSGQLSPRLGEAILGRSRLRLTSRLTLKLEWLRS
jgi:hypothetical protein